MPASVALIASSPQLNSAAVLPANGVLLTATVKDASNVVISGASVAFSTTDPGSNLTVLSATTDSSGSAQAQLSIGSSKASRSITVTATSGGVSSSVAINVTGTSITVSGSPSAQFNTASNYIATLTDSSGAGISGQQLTFSSTGGSFNPSTAQTTDASGQVTVAFTPTTSSASAAIVVAGLGVTASKTIALSQDGFAFSAPTSNLEMPIGTMQPVSVTWTRSGSPVVGASVTFSSTRGTLSAGSATTNASGVATVSIGSTQAGFATFVANGTSATTSPTTTVTAEFVATTPNSISVQPDPAVISTNQNSTILAVVRDSANNLVKNAVVNFTLTDTTGGQLSAPSSTTNSQGVASTVYQASSSPSAQNGVKLTAVVGGVSNFAYLTVGARAARIALGTGNEITEPNPAYYEYPYVAIVTDNAGNPAPDADLRLAIAPTFYVKGFYIPDPAGGANQVALATAVCPNEDANLNGILDAGEDTDGDGVLDPTNVATVPSTVTLDQSGSGTFNIRYPQSYGNWTYVALSAKASVSGTETTEISRLLLPISAGDAPNPPGNPSPYGTLSRCDIDDAAASQVEFDTTTTSQTGDETTATTITFTVKLDKTFTEDIVVPLSYSGTATINSDFTAPNSVTITAGTLTKSFNVTIGNDGVAESTEYVFIDLGHPSNAKLGANTEANLTITGP